MTSTITLAQESAKAPVWDVPPFQIVSLLEMLEHRANLFYTLTRRLGVLQLGIRDAIKRRGSDALPEKSEADMVRVIIKRLKAVCDEFEFSRVMERLYSLNGDEPLLQPLRGDPFTLTSLKFELGELNNEIARTLGEKKFMMIPADEVGYHENPDLFGPEVAARFPNANKEITEAGSCYATGNCTACVFHLMRALEYGLRALARRLKVPFPKTFELKTWDELIKDVEKEIQKIINKPKTAQRTKDLVFYNGAAAQFRYFKDAWRNHVMHTRASYDEHQAMSVMVHVREFMQHLAIRLKE